LINSGFTQFRLSGGLVGWLSQPTKPPNLLQMRNFYN